MKKLFSSKYSDTSISLALFILRLGVGGLMIPHGYQKLANFAKMQSMFGDPIHIGTTPSLVLTIFAEFFCAVLVVLGLLTRFATIPLIIVMSIALFIAHDGQIFKDGEMAGLFLAGYLTLLFAGPGKYSMDRLIGK
jgi:putative oxidoreductase